MASAPPSLISESQFSKSIAAIARDNSRFRKAEKLLNHAYLDEAITSTPEEVTADWRNSILFWIDRLVTGVLPLERLHSGCYWHLEGIWTEQIKEYRPYHCWLQQRTDETYWNSQQGQKQHYFWACEELRSSLITSGYKNPPS